MRVLASDHIARKLSRGNMEFAPFGSAAKTWPRRPTSAGRRAFGRVPQPSSQPPHASHFTYHVLSLSPLCSSVASACALRLVPHGPRMLQGGEGGLP